MVPGTSIVLRVSERFLMGSIWTMHVPAVQATENPQILIQHYCDGAAAGAGPQFLLGEGPITSTSVPPFTTPA